jgi:hypothetical protein
VLNTLFLYITSIKLQPLFIFYPLYPFYSVPCPCCPSCLSWVLGVAVLGFCGLLQRHEWYLVGRAVANLFLSVILSLPLVGGLKRDSNLKHLHNKQVRLTRDLHMLPLTWLWRKITVDFLEICTRVLHIATAKDYAYLKIRGSSLVSGRKGQSIHMWVGQGHPKPHKPHTGSHYSSGYQSLCKDQRHPGPPMGVMPRPLP